MTIKRFIKYVISAISLSVLVITLILISRVTNTKHSQVAHGYDEARQVPLEQSKNMSSLSNKTISSYVARGDHTQTNENIVTNGRIALPPNLYAQYAEKYALTVDEAMTLMNWRRTKAFIGGDYERKARQVGLICLRHKLTRHAIEELIMPAPTDGHNLIWYTYYADRNLFFRFDDSGQLVKVDVSYQNLREDGTLE